MPIGNSSYRVSGVGGNRAIAPELACASVAVTRPEGAAPRLDPGQRLKPLTAAAAGRDFSLSSGFITRLGLDD